MKPKKPLIFSKLSSTTAKKPLRLKILSDVFGKLLEQKSEGKFESLDLKHLKDVIFDLAKGKY
jgi:hypothetical protein